MKKIIEIDLNNITEEELKVRLAQQVILFQEYYRKQFRELQEGKSIKVKFKSSKFHKD